MTQQEAQAINQAVATQWYQGFGLVCGGVEVGQTMEYEVLRVVGRMLKTNLTPSPPTPLLQGEGREGAEGGHE